MIIASPESIAKPEFKEMCYSPLLRPRLFSVIFDEGHCISQWGDSFRAAYTKSGDISWLLPPRTIFYVTSATMPEEVLLDVLWKLHLTIEQVTFIIRSNDRPNVFLEVRKMVPPQNSYRDLRFVLPEQLNGSCVAPKRFLIFFNSRDEAEDSVKYFLTLLPRQHMQKIIWLHAGMTNKFCEESVKRLKKGEIWGICCTDAVGMVK